MDKYVIDASAWIEYLDGTEIGKEAAKFIESENEVYTNAVTVTEIIAVAKKKSKNTEEVFKSILSLCFVFDADVNFCKEAGELYAEQKLKIKNISYGDIFVMLTAKKLNAKIITKDPDFKGMKNTIFLK